MLRVRSRPGPILLRRFDHEIISTAIHFLPSTDSRRVVVIVGHPEPGKKSVGIFEYILTSTFKVYLDVF